MSIPKSVKEYCNEDISLIENYEEALNSNEIYDCHHKLELLNGYRSKESLIDDGLYYNRPADELIFLKHSEHTKLHAEYGFPDKGKKISEKKKGHPVSEITRVNIRNSRLLHNSTLTEEEWKREYVHDVSEETRKKQSESHKGKKNSIESVRKNAEHAKERWKNPEYKARVSKKISEGVKRTYTDEHRRICSEANKGKKLTKEHIDYLRSINKEYHWYNNGKENIRAKECPEGFIPGRLVDNSNNRSSKGMHWFTNGVENVCTFECPEGFRPGRVNMPKHSAETKRRMSESHKQRRK